MTVTSIPSANPASNPALRRVAMVSLHTSPFDQPGIGDAGGMNVYVLELARRLAERPTEVDVFTGPPAAVAAARRGQRRHSGPPRLRRPLRRALQGRLPGQLCAFAREVLRTEAYQAPGYYDLVHCHYWLCGQVGALARDRWGVPLVHTMHTMGKVKNPALATVTSPSRRLA